MSQPVSSRWYPTLLQSHNVAVQFIIGTASFTQILYQSPVFINPGGAENGFGSILEEAWPAITTTGNVPRPGITGGSVTIEKNVDQRSQCQLLLIDETNFLANDGVLDPFGNEIRIYRGLAYDDGTTEMLLLGTFRITDMEAKDSAGVVQITVTGQDRSRIIARNITNLYYQTGLNEAYSNVIRDIAQQRFPAVLFNDTVANWLNVPPAGIGHFSGGNPTSRMIFTPGVYGLTYQDGDNLWQECRNLAAAMSCDLYFDRSGVLTLAFDPNLDYMDSTLRNIAAPVFTFTEGENATFTTADVKKSDSDAYSAVVITGEGQILGQTQLPIRSITAVDNDPNSPTYINGPYGTVLYEETNDYMLTQAQINSYANFKLATMSGKQQTVEIEGFVDTSLDVDDPIAVTRQRVGLVNQGFIIGTVQFPLTVSDVMQVTFRERRAFIYGAIQ